MRVTTRFRRLGLAASAFGLSLMLGGCESFDLVDLFPDGKKKLPGERRLVFPEGVPGVEQGIPPELTKGIQPGEIPPTAATTSPQAQPQQVVEEESKPAPKPRRAAARTKPTPTVAPEIQQQGSQPAQTQPWPSNQSSQQQSAWPAAPQPGTFSQ